MRAAPAVTAVVAVATFAIAYDNGGYSLTGRSALAVAIWWTILLGVALGVLPLERPVRAAVVPGLLLAAFAAWDLVSAAWSDSAENAFVEFDRTALYLGIYVLVVLTSKAGLLSSWIDGITAGIGAIAFVALTSRFFPGSFPGRGLAEELPSAATRLSFPLGYWNGLGIFVGLGFTLLVHSALAGGRPRRLLSVGALPAIGAVIYLTSSRGAVVATALGTFALVLAYPRRAGALVVALVGAAGAAIAVGALASRHALVNGPLGSAAARSEGREAAVGLLLICIATAVGHEWLASVLARAPAPGRRLRRAGLVLLVVGAAAVLVGVARSFESFTTLPTSSGAPGTVGTHLLSGSGSGRWQFWTAALDEFRKSPIHGGGAGSFQSWWARHGSFPYSVRDAHSLFVETLAELGIIGLLLLVAVFATSVLTAIRRLRAATGAEQAAIAALLGAFTVYLAGAAVDWMWELTAVSVVGIAVLGLLTGPATSPAVAVRAVPRRRGPVALAIAVLAGAILVAESIALLTGVELGRSQVDARAGRPAAARAAAAAASRIEPWAASPYLQVALVEESEGELREALTAIEHAVARDGGDSQLWLVKSRIENGLGLFGSGQASLTRARILGRSLPPR